MSESDDKSGQGLASPDERDGGAGGVGDGDSDGSAEGNTRGSSEQRGAESSAENQTREVPSPASLEEDDGEDEEEEIPPAWEGMSEELAVSDDAEPTGEERVGQLLGGRYRVTEYMGQGAMGDIFRAEHALMKKTVAIKVLLGEVTESEKVIERFRREAQAAANIDHPNVCVATDFGRTEGGAFFLVMEHLEGPTLQELVDEEERLSVDRTMKIARQIASALKRAHAVGVVHRDLKPENIMLVERGDETDFVKILDFGIARVRMGEETPAMTKAGAVFGTPNYMSPEQAAGDPVDHRTDLYSLGGLMYEMLTGHPVFEAERGSQVMAMHVSEEPVPPSEESSRHVPEALDALILQLLAKEPEDRIQDAGELEERLESLEERQNEEDVELTPENTEELSLESARETRTPPVEFRDADAGDGELVSGFLGVASRWFEQRPAWVEWTALLLTTALLGGFLLLAADRIRQAAGIGGEMEAATPEGRTSLAVGRARLQRDSRVQRAVEYYRTGAVGTAIEELNAVSDKYENNAHLHYLLGRYHAAEEEWTESITHYKRALKLEPEYIERSEMVQDLMNALGLAGDQTAEVVAEVIRSHLDRNGILDTLARTAWRGGFVPARARARELLRETGEYEDLPQWTKYSIQLRAASGCDEHRKWIDKLVELEDPRGVEILEILDSFPRNGCGPDGNRDCYGCVRSDIASAMEKLRTLEREPPEPRQKLDKDQTSDEPSGSRDTKGAEGEDGA